MRPKWMRVLAAFLLACTALAVWGETSHTDDGCEVEVHCIACRWAYSASVLSVDAPASPDLHESIETVPPACPSALLETAVDTTAPRGPPAA